MTNNPEARFREAERWLDDLIHAAEATIRARGIKISDNSTRFYHYKNEMLSWAFHFQTSKQRGSEIQTVWMILSMDESNTTQLRVWTRAELFQLGKLSRWETTFESRINIAEAAVSGLAGIVLDAINAGEASAETAA